MPFPENLARTLRERNMSRADLARRLGISQSAISQWFRKRAPTFPAHRLSEICAILNVTPNTLVGDGPGAAESQAAFDDPVAAANRLAEDEEFEETAEAVFNMLHDAGMPTDQRTVQRLTLQVFRDVQALGRGVPFVERLAFTISERRSLIERKWREAIRD